MKDELQALEALGVTLPSPAYIFGVVLFGVAGFAVYRDGKRMSLQATKWIGVVLMLYPYVVSTTWLLYTVGAALCIAAYLSARA